MICSRCGKENRPTSRFCSVCGNRLKEAEKTSRTSIPDAGSTYCGACGARHADNDRFCRSCGSLLKQSPAYRTPAPATGMPRAPETPAVQKVRPAQSPVDTVLVWGGFLTGTAGFFFFPYIISPLAIALGAGSLIRRNKIGAIAIAIGLCAILANYAYLNVLTWTAS